VLTTLNDKSSTGKYLQDALTNFQEGHFLGVSDNLNQFITSLWGTIYSNIQDINFNQEEDESDAEEQETQITTTGNLSWAEVKIELDELRKEIKSRARLENWENPLMKAVIDRVGVKEIDSLEKWKNDEIIQDIYNRYIPQVTLDQYYEVLNTYWQEIRDILENWRRT
jgi:hypothetical protein